MHYYAHMHDDSHPKLHNCVVVQDQASAVLRRCTCNVTKHPQLEFHGANSTMYCEECLINCLTYDGMISYGVIANEGAFVRLTRTSVETPGVRVIAKKGANAVVQETTFTYARAVGVISVDYSNVKLLYCSFKKSSQIDKFTSLKHQEQLCSLHDAVNSHFHGGQTDLSSPCLSDAVFCLDAGEMTAVACTITENLRRSLCASKRSVARVLDCLSKGNSLGGFRTAGLSMLFLYNSGTVRGIDGASCGQAGPCTVEKAPVRSCRTGFLMQAAARGKPC